MVFSSQIFLFFFLPLCLLFYYLTPARFRNITLLVFSFVFYVWGETTYAWLILLSIIFNYLWGLLLYRSVKQKMVLGIGVFVNLSVLVFYKYSAFVAQSFNVQNAYLQNLILPLGISFYTFHSISYLVDIYRKKSAPQAHIFNMGLYIINFPQLVAGPIVRYHDVEKQLTCRLHLPNRFANGVKLFIYGLAKKMIVANTLGQMADVVFNAPGSEYNTVYAWLAVFSYTLQIYFDFSGYSDMAIGLGRMFGFEFKQNFNLPYAAQNIRAFWRKWHMSLSNWFRDYLYIPLGGNKAGHFRTAINLLIVFLLCGLWHGANYTFIIWGLFHGFFLVLERYTSSTVLYKAPALLKHLYVWLVIMLGWVFFRSNDLNGATGIIQKMFLGDGGIKTTADIKSYINPYFVMIATMGFIISIGTVSKLSNYLLKKQAVSVKLFRSMEMVLLLLLFIWSVFEIISNTYNPFIYYRF